MELTERLRELDKKGYQPLTGAIGEEASTEIERLLILLTSCRGSVKADLNTYERQLLATQHKMPTTIAAEAEAQRLFELLEKIDALTPNVQIEARRQASLSNAGLGHNELTPDMIEAIYAAWHGAGVDIAGGNWARFVGMLPIRSNQKYAPSKKGAEP